MWNICSYPLLYSIVYSFHGRCWFIEALYYEYESSLDTSIVNSFCHPETCIFYYLHGDFWWVVVLTLFQWIIIFYLFVFLCLMSYVHVTLNSVILLLLPMDFEKNINIVSKSKAQGFWPSGFEAYFYYLSTLSLWGSYLS